jgi:hypothetical protein
MGFVEIDVADPPAIARVSRELVETLPIAKRSRQQRRHHGDRRRRGRGRRPSRRVYHHDEELAAISARMI